jgi:hypothetical protein
MKPDPRPCPLCGERFDTPMQVDVCGTCYQELRSSGAVALQSTGEFAPITPARAAELLRARQARTRARTGEPEVLCTWCGKARKDVKKLLASGDAHICNECVALCADVLEAELGDDWR